MRKFLDKNASLLLGAMLFFLTIATFSRCFNYGLINLDDYFYLTGHSDVVTFSGWMSIYSFFTDVSESIWMPLTWLSYAIDYLIFGKWYGGFHIHSVIVHAINTLLVWHLLMILVNEKDNSVLAKFSCFFAALAWSIHPLRCESVVFLASRKDVLSFFWALLALLSWVHGSLSPKSNRRFVFTGMSVIFFTLGSMCKPSVMTFPILCMLIDIFAIRRLRPLRYIVPFILMLFIGAFASWQQFVGGATACGAHESLINRLSVSVAAFGIYLRNTIFPFWLSALCVKQWPIFPRFMVPGAVLSAVWAAFLIKRFINYWRIRYEITTTHVQDGFPVYIAFNISPDYISAGMAWFAFAIAPMLGLATFGYHAYADRFTYIPSVGLALLLAVFLLLAFSRFGRSIVIIPLIILTIALTAITWWQTGFWQDDLTLFSRTVQIDGNNNGVAHRTLAMHHFEMTHNLNKALYHFEMARKTKFESYANVIGIYILTLIELGHDDDARQLLREFESEAVKHFGENRAFMILRGSPELNKDESLISTTYQFARIATLLGRSPSLITAKRDLEILRSQFEDAPLWQYLMLRYFTLAKKMIAAEDMLRKLRDPDGKKGYLQFRFLQRSDIATKMGHLMEIPRHQ